MNNLKTHFLIVLVSILTLSSCTSIKTLSNGKQIDKNLIGIWQGSETDQQIKGMKKEWKMTRSDDGTFVLEFKTISEGEIDEFIEKGTWWINGNTFFEYHDNSGKTDTYNYLVLNKEQIQFEMKNTEVKFEDKNYTFIDTRVSEINPKKSIKDALSIENAMKVNNVAEEYEYVRKNCQGCQLLGQSLINHNGKLYDKLSLKKEDDKEVSYYFDISAFYGKW
jgi:hypothetical protein